MKFIALFCFIGFAAASSGFSALSWQSGEEYVFDYNGRMLTGLPELQSHYSGLGMKCRVHLQVQGEGKFALQVRDVEYSRVSQKLQPGGNGEHGPMTSGSSMPAGGFSGSFEESNWRNLELPSFKPVPSETAEYLRKTTVFTINEFGGVNEVVVAKDEPEWAINFKKALVVIFQTKTKEGINLESNSINGIEEEIARTEELEGLSHGESAVYGGQSAYWKTTEESVDGRCTVSYQLNELPKYMAMDVKNVIEKPELCPEGKYFELIKNKDINSCSARASFSYYKPGFFKCPTGNCDGMWSRSSITKYIACGTSRSDLKIMTIINDGELQQDLLGFKSETFLTGTNQVLKLVSRKPISGHFNKPSNPITIPSLMYQYSLAGNLAYPPTQSVVSEEEQYGYGVLEGLTHEEKKMIQEEEIAKYLPRHILATGGSKVGRNVDQEIIPQVKELIKELVQEDLNQISKDAPKRQITMKVLSLARAFGLMTKSGIETVYGELKNEFSSGKEQTIFKNVFFDCVLMGGSITDVKLIKEWILNGEVTSKVQIASLLTFLPQYVTVPTEELLNELFELIKSEKISEHFQLYSHGLLGFTTLVERACLSTNKDTGYPTFVFGNFCNQDSEIVTGKLIPYLEQELKSGSTTTEKKNLIVLTLGLLSHKRVVSVLLPVIEETYARQSGAPRFGLGGVSEEIEQIDSAEFTRFLAVYSLGKVGKQYPELVTPVLMSVYLNKGETTEVRVSAFNTILSLEPSTAVLQQIGTSTWSETDMEVLKTVNTAFYTLMKTEDMEQLSTSSATLCRKVALIYSLIKKTGGSVPTSATIFNSEYLHKLGVGYTTINNWVSSSESFIPQTIYTKVIYYMDRFQFSPIEFAARFQGIENVINVLREAITTGDVEDSTEIRREINGELEKIIRELKLKTREHKGTQGALYLSFVENLKTFVSFDAISEEAIKEKIMPLIKNPERIIELLSGEGSSELLNFQRVMDIAMSEYLIPSDMGLPIVVETHMPIVVSVNGDLNLDLTRHMPRVNMKVKALYAAQYTGWVGTICPFTQETLMTAIDEHTVFNVPAEFTVGLNIPESKLNVVVKPCESLNGPMDVVHYHVRPYTVHQKYWNMKPMTLSQNVNYIKSRTPTMEKVIPFGQEYLGLNLRTVIKSESRFMDKTSILEKLSLYNYNPMNIVRFFWASTSLNQKGYPSLRSHEYRIVFNQAESSTKEIEFNLRIGVATKEIGTGMKYHKLDVVEGKRTILPYKVHSESLESVSGSGHVERVQKLKSVVEKLGELETATGFTMTYSVVLRGASRPRTYTYSATVATGSNRRSTTGLTQKWNLHLESENSGKKICVNGDVAMPLIPVWKINELRSTPIQYHYNNHIGFGNTCEEHTIKISGSSSTSEEQKKYSRESPEARLLEKLRSEGRPVTELSELAEKVRNQASVLDTIVFRTEYHNIPATIMKINDFTVEFFKTLWWPFLEKVEGSVLTPNGYTTGSSTVKIVFHPERETVDITLHRPSPGNQLIVWKNIRMVTPFTYVLPKVAGKPVIKSLEQAVRGNNVYPVCKLEGDYMKTFKNRTVEAKIDGCFHLLAADCGKLKEFAILVRSLSSVTGPKEVKVILETAKGASKTVLFTPMDKHSKVSGHIRVTINGSEKNLRHGDIISVEGPKTPINPMGIYGEISLSVDGVIRMTTRTFEILFNGNKVEVEGSQLLKGKVCGVCGDYGNVKASDLRGPSKCIYSKPELLIASYKVQSEGCPRTVGKIAEELRKANEECTTIQVLPTKVLGKFGPYIPAVGGNSESEGIMSSLYGSLSGYGVESGVEGSNCELIHRNVVLHEGSRICFSRFPVVGCSSGCRGGNKVEKKISFTCLENSRAARHIERRIENGETVTELETMPESFTRTHELPKTCRPFGY